MRVFVAGATGALGRPLLRELQERGASVVGLTRSPARRPLIESLGAEAAVADALEADALRRAVVGAQPTHVVHLLTALPPRGPLRPRDLRDTNRLRTVGTRNLIEAARAAGARRIVAESFVGVYGSADFHAPQDETAALQPAGAGLSEAVSAMRELERQLAEARDLSPVALRIGLIYGAQVQSTLALAAALRAGRVAFPRRAPGVGSFVHVDDAARGIVAALESAAPGPVYNVVDDEPMPIATYLDLAARAFGAQPPRSAPLFVMRWLSPLLASGARTRLPLSNARARAELGWQPRLPSLRVGLAAVAREWREAA